MIIFEKIFYKNILSVGDQGFTVNLNTGKPTLIIGKNGGGKSTIIDALVYVLFGKPFRKVRLGQLINNINEKGLLVEVDFTINGKEYKVRRGMKPSVFEIFVDGELIEPPAESKIYQNTLENDILRLNYKTFTQIAILGSASYKPFMQLPLGDRREIIESLLDIGVFSRMNDILKAHVKQTKYELTEVNHQIELKNQEYKDKRAFLNEFNLSKKTAINNMIAEKTQAKKKIDDAINQHKYLKKSAKKIEADIKSLSKQAEIMEDAVVVLRGLLSQRIQLEGEVKRIDEQLDRSDNLKKQTIEISDTIEQLKSKISNKDKQRLHELEEVFIDTKSHQKEAIDIRKTIATLSYRLDQLNEKINFYEENDSCDSCGQQIDPDYKKRILKELNNEHSGISKQIKVGNARLKEISDIIKKMVKCSEEIEECKKNISSVQAEIKSNMDKIEYLEKERKLIEENGINEVVYNVLQQEITDVVRKIDDLEKECAGYDEIKENLNNAQESLNVNNQAIQITDSEIIHYKEIRSNLLAKITEAEKTKCSISENDIQAIRSQIISLTDQITEKKQILYYFDLIQKMLKDDGVKTVIIEEFLPIINGTVNMYLDKFDFPIQFMFDSKFSESISSFNRNDFTYYSFSEGEKARIDLSILFTWRDIAIRKARSATNILIFDEVFDGSMDVDGIENFMSILGIDTSEYTPFVITHDEDVKTANFSWILEFSKQGNFTIMKETI
jgi:DNA repair exonuclease SbcCD ATPase subunit